MGVHSELLARHRAVMPKWLATDVQALDEADRKARRAR